MKSSENPALKAQEPYIHTDKINYTAFILFVLLLLLFLHHLVLPPKLLCTQPRCGNLQSLFPEAAEAGQWHREKKKKMKKDDDDDEDGDDDDDDDDDDDNKPRRRQPSQN